MQKLSPFWAFHALLILALIYAYSMKPQIEGIRMSTFSFTYIPDNQLPSDWCFINGSWNTKALIRPQCNRIVTTAVDSPRHVAFPGICMTKKGTLIAVYREGYSHASGFLHELLNALVCLGLTYVV